jgi:phosphoglycolate phosphatase
MSAFKAVVFDYDGTLYDTRPAIVYCLRRALEEHGRPAPAPDALANTVRAGLTLPDSFLALDEKLRTDPDAIDGLVLTYRTLYFDEAAPLLKPFAGVCEALERVHRGGVKCAVVSNKGVAAIRRSLDDSGLGVFVDVVFGDEAGLPNKPDPAVLTGYILPKLAHLHADELLMVGDTETDIVFAKTTGMAACWASYGYGTAERCRKLEPDYEIASIAEVPSLVGEL